MSEDKFSFMEISLQKDQPLGSGSYGAVCKAKCDALTCAAKILHAVFFSSQDFGQSYTMARFQQECHILSAVKHPNIVQYLGATKDKDTDIPVLLMELMDENLTHYLNRHFKPLPFYTDVNISLDIAQALAYLHSNNIQHRDLSSNNILLSGEGRAKVTDFGMSRLQNVNSRMTPATMCPGTAVYMPPEALREHPHYTDEIDIFSFGVLLLQIMTRQFPDPSDRFVYFETEDPVNKEKTIQVQAPVKETKRRQSHIGIVGENPLLKLSLHCLEDNCEERPSARDLCQLLEEKKMLEFYQEKVVDYELLYDKICQEADKSKKESEKVQVENDAIKELHWGKVAAFETLLLEKEKVIDEQECTIKELKARLLDGFSLHWKRTKNPPVKFKGRGHTAVKGKTVYFHELSEKSIYKFNTKKEVWKSLPEPPLGVGYSIVIVQSLLTTIGGLANMEGCLYTYRSKGEKNWTQNHPPMGLGWINPSAITVKTKLIVMGRSIESCENLGMVLDVEMSQWTRFETPQFSSGFFDSAFMFASESTLYYAGGYDCGGPTPKFYSCPIKEYTNSSSWTELRHQPFLQQATTCIKGRILSFGGVAKDSHVKLNVIYKYDCLGNCWEKVGEMDLARSNCMVAVLEDKVIVVGGEDSDDTISKTELAIIDTTTVVP